MAVRKRRVRRRRRNVRKNKLIKRAMPVLKGRQTFVKLKVVTGVTVLVGGIISDTTTAGSVSAVSNYATLAQVYENFILHAIKVKYIPYHVGDESSTVGATIRGNVGTLIDWDGNVLPGNFAAAAQYDTFKMNHARYPITRYARIAKKYRPVLNDSSVGYSTNNKAVTIFMFGDNFTAGQTVFWKLTTYYVEWSNVL